MDPPGVDRPATAGRGVSISHVSRMVGIPVPTIRSWERRYGFPAPPRTDGHHRRYTQDEIGQLRWLLDEITRGYAAGEAVEVIRERMSGLEPVRERYLDPFIDAARALDPMGIRRVLDAAAEELGVERALHAVALPAMREVGRRWRTGSCDIGTEHFATAMLRRWFARLGADGSGEACGVIVLACGPAETHTLGLEAFAVILTRDGWDCRMLGGDTPAEAVVSAVRAAGADAVLVSSHRRVNRRAAVDAIRAADRVPRVVVFYAGDAFTTAPLRRGVPGTYLGTDMSEAATIVRGALPPRTSTRNARARRAT